MEGRILNVGLSGGGNLDYSKAQSYKLGDEIVSNGKVFCNTKCYTNIPGNSGAGSTLDILVNGVVIATFREESAYPIYSTFPVDVSKGDIVTQNSTWSEYGKITSSVFVPYK